MQDIFQTYPMHMQLCVQKIESGAGIFSAKFCNNDFFMMGNNFVPVSSFIEMLGQSAELYIQTMGDYSKRYLAQIVDFRFNPELYQELFREFSVRVQILQRLGRIYKSHVFLSFEGKVFCEGVYVHYNT